MNGSFRLSVCLSDTPFSLCTHYRIMMEFSGFIANDMTYVMSLQEVKFRGQGQGHRGQNPF